MGTCPGQRLIHDRVTASVGLHFHPRLLGKVERFAGLAGKPSGFSLEDRIEVRVTELMDNRLDHGPVRLPD